MQDIIIVLDSHVLKHITVSRPQIAVFKHGDLPHIPHYCVCTHPTVPVAFAANRTLETGTYGKALAQRENRQSVRLRGNTENRRVTCEGYPRSRK
jgi:hypothetical protein